MIEDRSDKWRYAFERVGDHIGDFWKSHNREGLASLATKLSDDHEVDIEDAVNFVVEAFEMCRSEYGGGGWRRSNKPFSGD